MFLNGDISYVGIPFIISAVYYASTNIDINRNMGSSKDHLALPFSVVFTLKRLSFLLCLPVLTCVQMLEMIMT